MTAAAKPLIPAFAAPLRPYGERLESVDAGIEARFQDYRIQSAYQPIFSFAHGRPVGYEALARARTTAGPVSPGELFGAARTLEEAVFLDRLLRALHVANFVGFDFDNGWLFLNISPATVINGRVWGPF